MTRIESCFASGVLFFSFVLSGCAVGPDFKRPEAPEVTRYTEVELSTTTISSPGPIGNAQTFATGQDIPAEWWKLFHSKALDEVIDAAIRNSPTVAAARAALENARKYALAQRDSLLIPAVDAQAGETRERLSTVAFGLPDGANTFSLTTASVNVSYNLDLFGANRRQVEGLEAQAEVGRNLLRAAQITLAANITTAAIHEAGLREQIKATESVAQLERKMLDILQIREKLGAVSQSEVQTQRAALALTRASLLPLQNRLAQTRHLLSVYAGKFPGESGLPEFRMEEFTLPRELPVSLPSALIHQRPDILASEAQLHQATANLGMTIAGVYPNVTLSASMGAMSLVPGTLFSPASNVWSLGTGLAQPLFHGGALEAAEQAARASLDQAAAQYRQTVLSAFQNVADVLRALETDSGALAAQMDNVDATHRGLALARAQYDAGGISFLALLGTEERDSQSRIALAMAQSNRLADTAALFLAMGGGWWNHVEASP